MLYNTIIYIIPITMILLTLLTNTLLLSWNYQNNIKYTHKHFQTILWISVIYWKVKIDANLSWQYQVNDLNRANALLFEVRKYVYLLNRTYLTALLSGLRTSELFNSRPATSRGRAGCRSPLPFFENRKKVPWFWGKVPCLCVSMG